MKSPSLNVRRSNRLASHKTSSFSIDEIFSELMDREDNEEENNNKDGDDEEVDVENEGLRLFPKLNEMLSYFEDSNTSPVVQCD